MLFYIAHFLYSCLAEFYCLVVINVVCRLLSDCLFWSFLSCQLICFFGQFVLVLIHFPTYYLWSVLLLYIFCPCFLALMIPDYTVSVHTFILYITMVICVHGWTVIEFCELGAKIRNFPAPDVNDRLEIINLRI